MVESQEGAPIPSPAKKEAGTNRNSSPLRLRVAMEAMVLAAAGKINLYGRENFDRIPPNSKIIFVTTHVTDFDLPLAFRELSKRYDIKIADISGHRHLTQDPLSYLGEEIAGSGNFASIDYRGKVGEWRPAQFNPENFRAMRESLESGKAIIIAGHNPTKEGHLPGKPGMGASYLAQITPDSIIVPITVNIKSKNGAVGMAGIKNALSTIIHRPPVDITVGEPIKPQEIKIPGKGIYRQIPTLSRVIMTALAKPLPPEKRGIWGKTTT